MYAALIPQRALDKEAYFQYYIILKGICIQPQNVRNVITIFREAADSLLADVSEVCRSELISPAPSNTKKYEPSKDSTMDTRVWINPDNSEKVQYNTDDYPVYVRRDVLSTYPNYTAVSHWHDDVELIAILSGHMIYNVNGEATRLDAGNGIFVNARQLHYGYSDDRSECIFICVIFHPMLLCASRYLEQKFVAPILSDSSLPWHFLDQGIGWEAQILEDVQKIYGVLPENTAELKIQSLISDIWSRLYQNRKVCEDAPPIRNHHLSALKEMVAFIQEHYREKISLSDIARAGGVGKTSCCAIFRRFVNQTPNAYLTDYRLRKGAELLLSTNLTVTEICYEVGFSGGSYFTETFHRCLGCSPGEYRKNSACTAG